VCKEEKAINSEANTQTARNIQKKCQLEVAFLLRQISNINRAEGRDIKF